MTYILCYDYPVVNKQLLRRLQLQVAAVPVPAPVLLAAVPVPVLLAAVVVVLPLVLRVPLVLVVADMVAVTKKP